VLKTKKVVEVEQIAELSDEEDAPDRNILEDKRVEDYF
jgi:hypothetical protein